MSWNYGGSSATRLKDWLDPDNTSATVLDGMKDGMLSEGELPASATWSGSHTLTGNITVPSGVTLSFLSGSNVNFNGNYILVNGNVSGANYINCAYLKQGGTLKGLFGTVQSAINYASSGYTVELQSRTYTENITISNKDYLTIKSETSNGAVINGYLIIYSSSGVRLDNIFTCSKINMNGCQDAQVYVNILGSGIYNGIHLLNSDNFNVSSYLKNFAAGVSAGSSDGYVFSYLEDNNKGINAVSSDVYSLYSV